MRRSSRALAFEQTFYPMTLITRQPLGNLRAWCLQNRRQLPAGAPLRIQHYRLQPLGHAIGSIPFRLFAQSNQPLIGARTQMNHSGKHGTPPTGSMPCFYLNVPLVMRACIVVAPMGLCPSFDPCHLAVTPQSGTSHTSGSNLVE